MTIIESARALRGGAISSVELVSESLSVIRRLNPSLNAFITVTENKAMERARAMDVLRAQGSRCGPLCGIPFALKDVFSTKGVRTTSGSSFFADHITDSDSAVMERLESAGGVLVGKTGLHEFAYGTSSQNPHFGAVRNPWDPDRIPGGSSGGSGCAVAAGMVPIAMGTDTGGSIRIPASYCGTVGLKPTSGRISRFGVMPLDFTLDHMGPLTRSVRDAALILNVLAGRDDRDDSSSPSLPDDYFPESADDLRTVRVGWPENFFFERIDPEIEAAVRRAARLAEILGAEIVPVPMPGIADMNLVGRIILMSEASALLGGFLDRREDFGADVRLLVEQGALLPATSYVNAQRLRRQMMRDFAPVWTRVDCLLTPTTPIAAPLIGADTVDVGGVPEDARMASTRFTRCFNVLGVPAISLPCGFTTARLPIGIQIVAPPFQEKSLLRIAAVLEDALNFEGLTQ